MRVVCVNARKTCDGQILSCREGEVYTVLRRKTLDDGRPMVQVRGPGCSGEGVFSWFLESRFEPHNDDRSLPKSSEFSGATAVDRRVLLL